MTSSYDVIVAGGGMAGTAAALASARTGARTLLVERNHCLGGAATMRNVSTWCGMMTLGEEPRQAVFGIAEEVMDGLRALGGLGPVMRFRGVFLPFDPEPLKRVLDDLTEAADVDVQFGATVTGARRDPETGRVTRVTVSDHGGDHAFEANGFVDCTGDGDLAMRAGASTRYGNPDGINLGTLGTRFGGIPADVEVRVEQLIEAVAAQNFPPGTVTKDRCVIVRLPRSHDMVLYLASADYDPRDANSLVRAERSARRQAWAYLDAVRAIQGCEDAYLVSTGPEIGTRESRHLNCRYQLTWADVEARRRFDDCIALGAWGAEWHDRQTSKSSFEYGPNRQPFEIPLSCLHSADTPNLFCAGRLADGDRKAGAAIRVMGTAMATGQAAGIAAALSSGGELSSSEVRSHLRKQGAIFAVEALPT